MLRLGHAERGAVTLLVSLGFVGGVVASRNCEGQVGMDSEPVRSCNAPVRGMFLLLMALWPHHSSRFCFSHLSVKSSEAEHVG